MPFMPKKHASNIVGLCFWKEPVIHLPDNLYPLFAVDQHPVNHSNQPALIESSKRYHPFQLRLPLFHMQHLFPDLYNLLLQLQYPFFYFQDPAGCVFILLTVL